jgi:hypothetical protein
LLARCVGYSMSTPHGAPHACVLLVYSLRWFVLIQWFLFYSAPTVPYVKRNGLRSVAVTVPIMVPTGRHKDSFSFTGPSSTPSISTVNNLNPNSATEQASHSDTMSLYYSAKSFDDLEMQGKSSPPTGMPLAVPPASVPPHFSDRSESTMPVHASSSVETVWRSGDLAGFVTLSFPSWISVSTGTELNTHSSTCSYYHFA